MCASGSVSMHMHEVELCREEAKLWRRPVNSSCMRMRSKKSYHIKYLDLTALPSDSSVSCVLSYPDLEQESIW